ncbi:MAG: transcriptional regulator [Alphaproteobacteria bacterium]|nr:transcriptional regulator [Alphaproteobacteria bacterium]
MSSKKIAEPSPASAARAERQRIAREEGAQAMAEAERRAVELRQNMQRLRALREAKEADENSAEAPVSKPARKRRVKRIVR